jgi:hypothetical protein
MSEASKGKELARKLGIKKGMSLAIMNPPYGFVQPLIEIRETLREMHTDVKMREAVDVEMFIYFTRTRKGLEETFPKIMEDLKPDGTLWLGWLKPKGVKTDLNEKVVKEIAQKFDMKDVDSMTLSDEWPLIKFVRASTKK